MAYFSMQTSAWILTAISIDRYLIVTNHNWKQKYSRNLKFNLIVIGFIVAAFALINSPVTVLNGRPGGSSGGRKSNVKVECYTTPYVVFWQKFSLLFECIFPLSLMILFNYLLIKRTLKSSTKLRSSEPSGGVSSTGGGGGGGGGGAGGVSRPSASAAFASSGNYRKTSIATAGNSNKHNRSRSSLSFTRDDQMSGDFQGSTKLNSSRPQIAAPSLNDYSSNNDSKLKVIY